MTESPHSKVPGSQIRKEILRALKEQGMSTKEVQSALGPVVGQCPDEIARELARMRRQGLIKGEVSQEKGGWVWWKEKKG
jgi:predicted transcriptional regulator